MNYYFSHLYVMPQKEKIKKHCIFLQVIKNQSLFGSQHE